MNFLSRLYQRIRNPHPETAPSEKSEVENPSIALGNLKTRLDSESPQFCPAERNRTFEGLSTDIRTIALYLPQFHRFKENDEWWGEGFTEWTNVRKGIPHFEGQNQPRIPHHDIGYYDLSTPEAVAEQVRLARAHGIYAFGMYYYWFSGHRLMEKPMDILLAHPDMDIPFFAIWANENFTRTWDGLEQDVLLAQEYLDEDPRSFIESLAGYIGDERYLRVDGKPVIGLYNPSAIPDVRHVLTSWRDHARSLGLGEIAIWACITEGRHSQSPYADLIDGEYDFPPRGKGYVDAEHTPDYGAAYNYLSLVESARRFPLEPFGTLEPCFRGTMMEWDNAGRKSQGYEMWKNYSPFRFYIWNRIAAGYLRANFDADHRFLFVNAWNEWGEGTYLEPDERYGYANVNALSKAIYDLPFNEDMGPVVHYIGAYRDPCAPSRAARADFRIAIQAHIFHEDLAGEFASYLQNMTCPFDLYVTTDSPEKAQVIEGALRSVASASNIYADAVRNRGRNVLPLLGQMRNVIDSYDLLCHIHIKKSLYDDYGKDWRTYLLQNLLGSEDCIADILGLFAEDEHLGVVFPQTFHAVADNVERGSNQDLREAAAERIGQPIDLPDPLIFPAGNMMWVRCAAVRPLFAAPLEEFYREGDDEKVDDTIMHGVERLWVPVAQANGYGYKVTRNLRDDFDLEELKRPTLEHPEA